MLDENSSETYVVNAPPCGEHARQATSYSSGSNESSGTTLPEVA